MTLRFSRAIRLPAAPAAPAMPPAPAAPRLIGIGLLCRVLRRFDGMLLIGALLYLGGCDGTSGLGGDLRQVSESGFGAYEVALVPHADRLAVAWYDTRDGNAEIYMRLLNSADIGGAAGSAGLRGIAGSASVRGAADSAGTHGAEIRGAREYRLTDSAAESYEASIDALPSGFAVAWYEKSSDERLEAQLGQWSPERGFEWRRALSAAPGADSRNPVVAAAGDRVFCAWIEKEPDGSEAVRGRWFAASDGTPLADSVRLGAASPTTWNLNAAIGGGGAADEKTAVVVYDAETETKAAELFAAQLQGARVTLRRLTDDDGYASKYPDLAFAEDGVALTWFDERDGNQEVYLYVGAGLFGEDAAEPIDGAARRITRTPGHSIGAYVAYVAGRYGLAWSDDSEGSYDVYFQTFHAADGAPEAPIRRLTTTRAASLIPAIRPFDDGFAVAWTEVTRPGQGMHDAAARAEIMLSAIR